MPLFKRKIIWFVGSAASVLAIGAIFTLFIGQQSPPQLHANSVQPETGPGPQDDGSTGLLTVKTIFPKYDPTFAFSVQEPATVSAYYLSELDSQVAGQLARIRKAEGASVKAGELLAKIAVPDLEQEVALKEAVIQQRQQELEVAKSNRETAQRGVEVARNNIEVKKAAEDMAKATELYRGKMAPMTLSRITQGLRVPALVSGLLLSAGIPDSIRAQSSSAAPPPNEKPVAPSTVAEPPSKGFAGLGPSPSGGDVRVLPIDLPTTLRLADANNPTVALARERINEAYALLRQAQVMFLPNLQIGPAYVRHDGLLQNSSGLVFPVSKWNFFEGGGAVLSVETSEALFAPLVARRVVEATAASAQGVANRIQLDAASQYLDLLQAYGALAINAETLGNARRSQEIAGQIEKAGLGKTPADANRVRSEVRLRQEERTDLEGQAAVASAQLARILMLDPTVDLRPADPAILPIILVPAMTSLDELTATGLMNRPELAEGRAQVAVALARWRQARTGPFFPRLEVDYNAGEFGGGTNDETQRFGGRGDGLAQAVWTLHNLGAGDVAQARARRSQYNQTNLHLVELETQVAAEVTAAAKRARARQRALEHAEQAVQDAEKAWQQVLNFTLQAAFRKVRQFEALELLIAERDLDQARRQYLNEVIEYNRAQFQLYWALGQPPMESLAQSTSVPVKTPVLPPEKKD